MRKQLFDTAVRPQDDFFGYVNNQWLKQNPIPKTETTWGTFYMLRDKSWRAVHSIMKELKKAPIESLSSDQRLLRDFFTSTERFSKNGPVQMETLSEFLNTVHDRLSSRDDLAYVLGALHRTGINLGWALYVSEDDKDSSKETLRFYQAGLSLPNRDYYLEKTKRMAEVRGAYKKYYGSMLELIPQLGNFDKVWKIEKELAKASWDDVTLRDVQKNYTRLSLTTIKSQLPEFDWDSYWSGLRWDKPSDDLIIDQLAYVQSCIELLMSAPLENVRAYIFWKIVTYYAAWLSHESFEYSFDFYGRVLTGQKEPQLLWKRAVLLADRLVIGEALGREYASRHFPETSKKAVLGLVEDVRTAYHTRIDRLSWMSSATKKRAHKKLDNIKVFIGYPSKWKSLDKLEFTPDEVIKNIMISNAHEFDTELAKVGSKPKEEEWEMNAHTVNAYHHPNRLEIVFPAAILQPPFYDPKASLAVNLGGIGSVIGHEFTHGFDDQGSEFDENGNTHPWQSPDEKSMFNQLAHNIAVQADAFETVPGTFLQGKLILGEAIADIGGLELALEALEAKKGSKADFMDLFVNFATCECGHSTPERLMELAKIDPHPPSRFRVNCVVNHIDKFYELYDVKPGDKLYLDPVQRAKIW